VRGCKEIADPGTKEETLRFAREEFKRNKGVKDLVGSFSFYRLEKRCWQWEL
jgi:hypothetical protein